MAKLTHFNEHGDAHMVDVGAKAVSARRAIAEGLIRMQRDTFDMVRTGAHAKGDVLSVARIAAIMAAKKTAELIPLCHPIALDSIEVEFEYRAVDNAILCRASVASVGRTGVEMEALTAVQIGLLTIYDMCKAVDRGMSIHDVGLVLKTGGKSGTWTRERHSTSPSDKPSEES